MKKELFNTYGVSGIANVDITAEFATRLGAAYGASLAQGGYVLVTRDAHKTSRMLDRAMISGVLAGGVHVYDLGLQPVAVARFVTKALRCAGGLHLRHSPWEKTVQDIKFFDENGLDLESGPRKEIENFFHGANPRRVGCDDVGELSFPARGLDYYVDAFLNHVNAAAISGHGLKIVLDYAFGSATGVFPSLLGKLGIEVVSLNAFVDEARMTRSESEHRSSMRQLCRIVHTVDANLGIMLDASAQKIFICDEKGEALSGQQCLLLFAMLHAMNEPGAKIAIPLNAAPVLEALVERHGASVIRCGNSNRDMMAAALNGATWVGDERGSFIFGGFFPGFDGMMATVMLMQYMARDGRPLSELCGIIARLEQAGSPS